MKKRIIRTTLFTCVLSFGLLTSCQRNEPNVASQSGATSQADFDRDPDDIKFPEHEQQVHEYDQAQIKAIQDHVASLGNNLDDVVIENILRPDGSVDQVFVIEGDIVLTRQQYTEMKENELDPRHYYSNNLVQYSGNARTLRVVGYRDVNDHWQSLTQQMRRGLSRAVSNLNNVQGLDLTFDLRFSSNYSSQDDIVVYRNHREGGLGGRADFPDNNGDPGYWVEFFTGMDDIRADANEWVATHELMHAIGLRHTDWSTRASCDSGHSNEGFFGVGHNHIPGTPQVGPQTFTNSIINACTNLRTDNGELRAIDRVALQWLY